MNKLPSTNQLTNSLKYENILEIISFVNLSKMNILDNKNLYENLLTKFSNLLQNKALFIVMHSFMNNYEEAIKMSLNSNLFIEAIILFKLSKNENFSLFNDILMKFQKFLSQKSIFQALKVQKVIEILNNYMNKNE